MGSGHSIGGCVRQLVGRCVFAALLTLMLTSNARADVVTFLGAEYEADSFVWCIDQSASSSWGGDAAVIRQQVASALSQLTTARYGIVAFGDAPQLFHPTLSLPTPTNLQATSAWLNQLVPQGARCVVTGAQAGLDLMGTNVDNPLVILVTVGGDTCGGVAANLSNPNCTRISAVSIGPGSAGVVLAQQLTLFGWSCAREFRRGDSNADGSVNVADAVDLLAYLFLNTSTSNPCPDARDADANGSIQLTDAVFLLEYLFASGPFPDTPGPLQCGVDVADDPLTCHSHGSCP